METYHAAYRWTRKELLHALRHHYQSRLRPSLVWTINILALFMAALSITFGISAGWKDAIGSAPLLVFAIYWLGLRRRVNDWYMSRGFEKSRFANTTVEWEITAGSIKIHSEGLSSSEYSWKVFIKIAEAGDGFLLYSHPRIFHWLPFSALHNPAAITTIREFAAANGVKYVQLKD